MIIIERSVCSLFVYCLGVIDLIDLDYVPSTRGSTSEYYDGG